jgi:NADH:ubiquinone oxidoreductase subunit K
MIVAILLLLLGVLGIVLNRGHLIIMLMSIELILLAASFLFLINSIITDALIEQVFTIMVLTVAAAESSIGLAIMVAYYRIKGTIAIKSLN